ncbi:MAG: DUF502 domain-containing protein [Rhodocyclaceae bacterium]|nr:DUF502 domain-containing protein [Rhodocyclaceae bacterium]
MKRYLLAGLLIWVPVGITAWVINTLVVTMDRTLVLLPPQWQPVNLFGVHIPGLGVILTILVVLGTGALAANLIGQKVLRWAELALARTPVVKGIYSSVKQVSDTLLAPGGQAFRKPLLVRFPHHDAWTIAFLTGQPGPGVAEHLDGEHLSVYVPTTPNPTSGYFIIVPRRDTVELGMSVDEALKYIISMGVVAPAPHAAASGDRAPRNPS